MKKIQSFSKDNLVKLISRNELIDIKVKQGGEEFDYIDEQFQTENIVEDSTLRKFASRRIKKKRRERRK